MVSVDRNTLISQIISVNPQLRKDELNKLSDAKLQEMLVQMLAGNSQEDNVDIINVNHSNSTYDTEITEDEAQDDAIGNIKNNAKQALDMLDNQDDGAISKGYNYIKEALKSDLAKSNVSKVIYKQYETTELLQKAKDNELTFKEYYAKRKDILYNTFPNIETLNDKQKQVIKRCIDSLTLEQINNYQDKIFTLPPKEDTNYKNELTKFMNQFRDESMIKFQKSILINNGDFKSYRNEIKFEQKQKYIPEDGDRLMSFNEVYKLEQGVEFNKDNIQQYTLSAGQYLFAKDITQKKDEIHNILDRNLSIVNGNNSYGANPQEIETANRNLKFSIYTALTKLYGNNPEKINKGLQELTGMSYAFKLKNEKPSIENFSIDNFQLIDTSVSDNSQFKMNTDMALPAIAQKILSKIDETYTNNMGGKNLEDYAQTMANDYKSAYGDKDASALATAFTQDQEGVVQKLRTGVEITGMIVMVGGMAFFPPAALAGGALASFGGVGIEAINENSKENPDEEKNNELKKEAFINAALLAIGMGAGKAGSTTKAMLTAKNAPKLVATAADIGVDSSLSLLGDLALTGQINLEGEGFSQIMALIMGHKGKIVKGIKQTKNLLNNKFNVQANTKNKVLQMPDGTLVEVKPDGSTVEIKSDEVQTPKPEQTKPQEGKTQTETVLAENPNINKPETTSPENTYLSREEIDKLKAEDPEHIQEMSNGKIFRIGENFELTLIGKLASSKGESELKQLLLNLKQPNGTPRFERSESMALIKLSRTTGTEIIETLANQTVKYPSGVELPRFNQTEIEQLARYSKIIGQDNVINIIKTSDTNGLLPEINAKLTDQLADAVIQSNKTMQAVYVQTQNFADNKINYKTLIADLMSKKDISSIENLNKLNELGLKIVLDGIATGIKNDMPALNISKDFVNFVNSIEPEILKKDFAPLLTALITEVPSSIIAKGFSSVTKLTPELMNSLPYKLRNSMLEAVSNSNEGLIDVYKNTSKETFNKIPDNIKEELSLKGHIYTDDEHISQTLNFFKTPQFKNIKAVITSKLTDLNINTDNIDTKLKTYFITNKTGNPESFIKYVENLDMQQLTTMAPRLKDFDTDQMLEFLNYHQLKNTEFTPEALTYNGSLTHDMTKELYSYDALNRTLSRFPNTNRNIGHLPKEWIDGVPKEKQKDFTKNIYDIFSNFTRENNIDSKKLKDALQNVFNKNVEIEFIAQGTYGYGYKVSVDGSKPFFLKIFKDNSQNTKKRLHGASIEPQNAIYANGKTNNFSNFYFGKVADVNDKDGFMINEYLPETRKNRKINNLTENRFTSVDAIEETGHNYLNGKICDYGAMIPTDKQLLENSNIAKYTRIITDNIILDKKTNTYSFNDTRLGIVKNVVNQAKNPKDVVEAISLIERNLTKKVDSNSLQALKDIKKQSMFKWLETNKPNIKNKEAYFAAFEINERISLTESAIKNAFKGTGLDEGLRFSGRTKGVQSVYDKLMSNIEKGKSLETAIQKVQDGFGVRTILEDFDYQKYPEIVEMYKKDPETAYKMAAKKQSEQVVKKLQRLIEKQQNNGDFSMVIISNYKGKDGLPYLNTEQINQLSEFAKTKGIILDIKTDDLGSVENIKTSGYTALQMNLQYKDGTIIEWQTRGSDVDKFAEAEHIMYDSRQKKDVTGGRKILESLYEPYENIAKNMKDKDFDEYMEYLTEYYKQLRLKELGFPYEFPKLPSKFDSRISGDGLLKLHNEKENILKANG